MEANIGDTGDTANIGDTVRVHYKGMLEDGTVFDSSESREPLEFTIGSGQVIPGFEQAVIGMSPGETITIRIPAEEAYGQYREEMMVEISKEQFPTGLEPELGQQLQASHEDGSTSVVTVIDITESSVKLDANHPLAGKDLIFDIELMELS